MATEILRPDAVGDYTNIANQLPASGEHWDKVAEAVADEDSTVVYTPSATQEKDAYNLEASSIPGGSTINSVKVYFRFRNTGTAYRGYCQPFLRLNTDEAAGTEVDLITGAYATFNEILARPGGGAWSVADLADLQVVIGLRHIAGANCICTQVYVEIDYTEVVVAVRGWFSKF